MPGPFTIRSADCGHLRLFPGRDTAPVDEPRRPGRREWGPGQPANRRRVQLSTSESNRGGKVHAAGEYVPVGSGLGWAARIPVLEDSRR